MEDLLATLSKMGVEPSMITQAEDGPSPYTKSALYSLVLEGSIPKLRALASTVRDPSGRNSAILYRPGLEHDPFITGHEYEHVLANQGLGSSGEINQKFDELHGGPKREAMKVRNQLVKDLVTAGPYLVQNWGMDFAHSDSGYFSPKMIEKDNPGLLYEQLASLSALEQKTGRRMVDDKYMRKHVFYRPELREIYDALTGLRQTRLDARDLPPYTRIPEKRKDDWIDAIRAAQ